MPIHYLGLPRPSWTIKPFSSSYIIFKASNHKARFCAKIPFAGSRYCGSPLSSITPATSHNSKRAVVFEVGRICSLYLLTAAACRHFTRCCSIFESRGELTTNCSILWSEEHNQVVTLGSNTILSSIIGLKAPAEYRNCNPQASSCSFLSMPKRVQIPTLRKSRTLESNSSPGSHDGACAHHASSCKFM